MHKASEGDMRGWHCHLDHHGRGEYDLDLEKKKKRSIINND
jgi:hypothetical protein